MVTALRSLLGFSRMEGEVGEPFEGAPASS
jgi:hypothetical protein